MNRQDDRVSKKIIRQLTRFLLRLHKCAALHDIPEIRIVSCRRIRDLLRPHSRRSRRFFRSIWFIWSVWSVWSIRPLRRPWPGRVVEPLSPWFYDDPIGHISGSHIRLSQSRHDTRSSIKSRQTSARYIYIWREHSDVRRVDAPGIRDTQVLSPWKEPD